MLVKSVQLGLSRCAGRVTMAESPHGRGRTPSTEAHSEPPPNRRRTIGGDAFLHSNLGRREAAPQVAVSERSRPQQGA
eukprot:11203675-Alexandrium_andersonii.AAC.1